MSEAYDPVEYIRASQPANDALLAHWKSHPDYDPERRKQTVTYHATPSRWHPIKRRRFRKCWNLPANAIGVVIY